MTSKRLLVAVLAVGAVYPATTLLAAPLPERTPPAGFASVNGPTSGRTLAPTKFRLVPPSQYRTTD